MAQSTTATWQKINEKICLTLNQVRSSYFNHMLFGRLCRVVNNILGRRHDGVRYLLESHAVISYIISYLRNRIPFLKAVAHAVSHTAVYCFFPSQFWLVCTITVKLAKDFLFSQLTQYVIVFDTTLNIVPHAKPWTCEYVLRKTIFISFFINLETVLIKDTFAWYQAYSVINAELSQI